MFSDVSLIIDGSFVYTKRISVPSKLSKWSYDQLLRDEFAEIASDVDNLICDYIPLSVNPDGSKQILACGVEKSHVETYLSILRAAGIVPSKVRLGVQAILRFISSIPKLKQIPFVLSLVDGEMLLSMIFQEGVSVFQSRTRLYGEDRPALVQNTLDALSGIIQFNKSQNLPDIEHCLYLGLEDSDLQIINTINTYPNIQFGGLDIYRGVRGAEMLPANAHIAYFNTFIPDSAPDLLYSMKMVEVIKKRNRPKKIWIPILAGVAAFMLITMVTLFVFVIGLEREVRFYQDYLNSDQVLSEKAEIATLNAGIAKANLSYDEANNLIEADARIPVITKEFINMIVTTGGDEVTMTGFTFNESDGTFRVGAIAADEFAASSFIERLRANNMVLYVGYLGWGAGGDGTVSFSFEVASN